MPVDPQSLSLKIYPSPTLMECAQEVDPMDPNVQAVGQRMIEMMFERSGVGLAAPQVGLSWRLFVTRDPNSEEDEKNGCVWINPHLEVICDELVVDEEGCLSLPEIRADIRRPSGIRISGFDCNGKPQEMSSNEFIARIWQHENDHLDGILILDKMTAMGRLVNRKMIRNLERSQ